MTVLRISMSEDGLIKNIFKCRSKEPKKIEEEEEETT